MIVPPQPPAVTDPIPPSTLLPDLVNEATAAAVQATTTSPTHSPQEAEQPASIVQQTNIVTTNNTYNSYAIEVPMAPETTAEQFGQQQQQLLYQQYYQQYQAQQQQLPAPASDPAINVPISHLLAGNPYPSLPKMPQASIVHSFAPVYESQAATSGAGTAAADIYQEYVQNPYNLTLQQHPQQQLHQQQQQQQQQAPGMANAFPAVATPANYFNVNVDPSSIPPGSELLYGQQ